MHTFTFMRIVITGATGNVGTSVLRSLNHHAAVDSIVGLARRLPAHNFPKTEHISADVVTADLRALFRGADCVVHLAWQLQPSHSPGELTRTNVQGSQRVFEAAAAEGVGALVYASSVGAYSPARDSRPVDESWPTGGLATSLYARQKAELERSLDELEATNPDLRVVRFRPALIFKRQAASEIVRFFGGPLVPRFAFHRRLLRIVPTHPDLAFQCVHSHDVGDAFARAIVGDARGAYNLATEPVLTGHRIAAALGSSPLTVSRRALRNIADLTWRMRLQPSEAGWVDLAFDSPIMSSDRAREQLGWRARHGATETLLELLDGIRRGDGMQTPPLVPGRRPERSARASAREEAA